MHQIDPKGRFRDSYYYNDLMYGIIAKLTEDISGSQWETLVTAEILNRLGMTSTSFFTSPAFNPFLQDVAQGYVKDNAALYPVSYEFLKWEFALVIHIKNRPTLLPQQKLSGRGGGGY